MRLLAALVALSFCVAWAQETPVSPLDGSPGLGDAGSGAGMMKGLSRSEKATAMGVDAKAYAKTNKMPGTFACYNAQTKSAAALADALDKAKGVAKAADSAFNTANSLYKKTQATVAGAKARKTMLHQKLMAGKKSYATTHSTAMNLFVVAKKDLNGYQNERKKVSLDARQSKTVLGTYLQYKKKYISVSAEAENPKRSATVKRYLALSQRYLKDYHKVQAAIKKSYGRAQVHQSAYFKLSKRYQDKANAAKKIAADVKATSVAANANRKALAQGIIDLGARKSALPPLQKKKSAADSAHKDAQAKYKAAAAKASGTKANYFGLASKAAKLKAMGDNAHASFERNKLRYAEFDAKYKDKSTSAKGVAKAMQLLSAKIKAATHTASLYDKSYQLNACKGEEEAEEELGEDAKATQGAAEAATVNACKEDARVSASSKEAAKTATSQRAAEASRLAVLQKEAAAAKAGRDVAGKVRDSDKAKADRLKAAAAALAKAAQTPCV